ncbi:MAG: TetR family transcriptional regulator [Gemmatimonadaceae bacterium]
MSDEIDKNPAPASAQTSAPASTPVAAARAPKLELLLTAAATTFATRGYSGTSMRDIAHDSGISLSGIYYYTRGKSSLLYEIQSRTIDALLASAAQALSTVTAPREQLLQFVENHVAYTNDHPAFVRVLAHETAPDGADERRQAVELKRHEYVRVLRDILDRVREQYRAPVSSAFAGDMLFAMMSGPRQWGVSDTELNVGLAARMIYDLFVDGFTGAPAATSGA